ncbi:MAG: polyribonucleotide nucleotidyltransferase [Patescibacteria group bacterium]
MIPGLSDQNVVDKRPVVKTYAVSGKEITIESGKLAHLADGSAVIHDASGNYLLTTAGIKAEANPSASFFPLSVEFQEKYYAAGKIGGNRFMKREGRPSETAILNSRLIDRPIRPMFPKGVLNEVQIISTILSSSGLSDFGFWGITGASLSLMLAGCGQFEGPVAGVRIAITADDQFVFDPTFEMLATAKLDLTVAGTKDAITMVESQAHEASDTLMIQAFEFAHDIIKQLCDVQEDFVRTYRETHELPSIELTCKSENTELKERIFALVSEEQIKPLFGTGKMEFHHQLHLLEDKVLADLGYDPEADENTVSPSEVAEYVYATVKHHMRAKVLTQKLRLDGRKLDEVRPVRSETGILPRTHGSVLFERGITQALSITTLGGPGDIQIVDDMFEEDTKRYIHHYNFPPFSVGEVRALRGVSRREIGHGRLAEKAVEVVLPALADFPYFIRVVSEITSCNGSSSMASICGSSLSLMDAGVPIKAMVAGVAMGMIFDEETRQYEILSDIQAQEDFLGDLDFKVAATENGITALQMDCKIAGLPLTVIAQVFAQAKTALVYISGEMRKTLAEPRPNLSPYAPFILSVFVPEEKMREVIGKGGETIQGIEKNFGVAVNLEDDGQCSITAKDQASGQAALAFIKGILKDDEVGDVLHGKIIKILDGVGAIVEWAKGKSGMMHISKLGVPERVEDINKYVQVGQEVDVKIINIDKEKGRIGLERITTPANVG